MADSNRAERLKAALRENLKRRKAQARGRAVSDAAPAPEPVRPPPDTQDAPPDAET